MIFLCGRLSVDISHADLLGREINIGDYVIFYCGVHQVQEKLSRNRVSIQKVDSDDSTDLDSGNVYIADKEDILLWKIKRGY